MLDCRLLPAATLLRVFASAPTKAVVAKPICDSHYADKILQLSPDARVIWLYRNATDVADSITRKWPGHMRQVINRLRERDLEWVGWRGERLADDLWAVLDSVWRPDLTDLEAAATFWCLRNQWFFRLRLDQHPRVRLVRYEDLVQEPAKELARIFAWVRVPYPPESAAALTSDHVGKASQLEIAADIARHCTATQMQLDQHLRTNPIATC